MGSYLRFFAALAALALALSCGGGRKAPSLSSDWTTGVLARHSEAPPPSFKVGDPPPFQAATPSETTLSQALADLDALPTPAGVDASVFSALKSALREALVHGVGAIHELPLRNLKPQTSNLVPTKLASRPPTGLSNRVDDLQITDLGDGTYTLTWSYRNVGDYNQDGIVNIMDITPLAVHFQESADETNEWIDGNRDSLINLADVTPLAVSFGNEVAGYSVLQAPDYPGYTFDEVEKVGFHLASGSERKRLRCEFLASTSCYYYAVAPYDTTGSQGDLSKVVKRELPPVPVLTAEPTEGSAPLTVTFDASESYDPDGGTINRYVWDWNGNGKYDLNSGAEPTAAVTYNSRGTYAATVWIADDEHQVAETSVTITVAGDNWVHTWGGRRGDVADAITVDSGGACVAGSTFFDPGDVDVLLLKYDPSGNAMWQKTWDAGDEDCASAVATDGYGNIYVVGKTYSSGAGGADVLLIKFDCDGDAVWTKTWGGTGWDVGSDLVLDSSGDIYVCANTESFGAGGEDVVLLKYDADGSLTSQKRWGGNGMDSAAALVLDGCRNVYVAGCTMSSGAGYTEVLLLKYDSYGNLVWTRTWGGGSGDGAGCLSLDGMGHIYVAGSTSSFGEGPNVLLLKYEANGDLVWSRTWGGAASDYASAVVAQGEETVYLVGWTDSFGDGRNDPFVLRYDSGGNVGWARTWYDVDVPAEAYAATSDHSGILYIAGKARDAWGKWLEVIGETSSPAGFEEGADGSERILEGIESAPCGIQTAPEGIEDDGSTWPDVLIMKLDPSTL